MQDTTRDAEEWVEEEQMVVVELSGIVDPDYLSKCQSTSLKVLGIETEEPVIQLGSYTFSGQHKNMLGTAVIFEKAQENGAHGSENLKWNFKCHTDKKIEMQRVHLKPKHKNPGGAKPPSQETEEQLGKETEAPP